MATNEEKNNVQNPQEEVPPGKKDNSSKKRLYTDDQEMIDKYVTMAQRVITLALSRYSADEQISTFFTKINRFVPALQIIRSLQWREIMKVINAACCKSLANEQLSKAERSKLSEALTLLNDVVIRIVENRKMITMVENDFLKIQKDLSKMLHRTPKFYEDEMICPGSEETEA